MLRHLLGGDPERLQHFNPFPLRWAAVLRTVAERDRLLEVAPVARGHETLERARLYGGMLFAASSGRAEWTRRTHPDNDGSVAQATKRGTGNFNVALGEGLVHTMTWLLCGTTWSFYANLPATQGKGDKDRTRDPFQWLQAVRAAVDRGDDWPLVHVPRERSDNFRDPVRHKAFTFMVWLLARHPDQWVELLVALGREARTEEEVAAIFAKVLGRPIGEVEAEWREWVRTGSRIGKASGLPQ
jgi:hypothetical protein